MITRRARPTLTALELDAGEALRFTLADGTERTLRFLDPWARILRTTLPLPLAETKGAVTVYAFGCTLDLDGARHELYREVGTQRSVCWDDGSVWELQCHHVVKLSLAAGGPVAAGAQVARGAGTAVGAHEHSNVAFAAREGDDLIRLDPWILFWQAYLDVHGRPSERRGHLEVPGRV